jgi:hypothetical protein
MLRARYNVFIEESIRLVESSNIMITLWRGAGRQLIYVDDSSPPSIRAISKLSTRSGFSRLGHKLFA